MMMKLTISRTLDYHFVITSSPVEWNAALDHPLSAAFVGLSLFLKFGINSIYSFGDIAIFIFCRLAWNCLFTPIFGGWAYFPQIWSPIVLIRKTTILAQKHVVWAIKRENRFRGSTWAQDGEKGKKAQDKTGQSNSHKVVIIRLVGEKPPLCWLKPKFA